LPKNGCPGPVEVKVGKNGIGLYGQPVVAAAGRPAGLAVVIAIARMRRPSSNALKEIISTYPDK